MEDSEKNPPAAEKITKKRSTMERAVVWVGILLLVGVALLEATSRSNYESSYKGLETVLLTRDPEGRAAGIEISEVDKYIKGSPYRTDKVEEERTTPAVGEATTYKKRRLRFQWPSLFKHYEFRLSVGKDDKVVQIDPVIPGIEN